MGLFSRNRISGQITVFSAVVMLAVLILAGLLVDISRINAGRTMVKRAVASAARSLLADYSSKLKEDYGIFAITGADAQDLQDRFEEYLACNLSIPTDDDYHKGSADLFGFRIEKVKVTPIYNLSENSVTKKQILEYMKYRAPGEIVEGFLQKLAAVDEVGKMAGAYKQKVKIDKLLGKMDKSQQRLKRLVDGTGIGDAADSIEKFINGFNLNGSWVTAYNSFNSMVETLKSMKSSLDSLDKAIVELELQVSQAKTDRNSDDPDGGSGNGSNSGIYGGLTGANAGNGYGNAGGADSNADGADRNAGNPDSDAESRLEALKRERSNLQDSFSDVENELKRLWHEIRHSLTGDYIEVNENAAEEIEKIVEKGREAQAAIAELERYLEGNFGSDEGAFSKDFKEQTQSELDKLKTLILEGKRAEEMLGATEANSRLLKNVATFLDQAEPGCSLAGRLPSGLPDMIKNYANVSYDYSRPDRGDKKEDPRDGKADAVKKLVFEKILDDVNYETAGINKKDLPSYTKVITESFDEEDDGFADGMNPGDGYGGISDKEAIYKGELDQIGKDMDLYNEDGMFQENALGFIADIGEIAAGGAAALRDNIYINEYIMGSFKNSVPELRSGEETVKDKNLHGIEKNSSDTFYDSEVEYILHGQPSQLLNNIMTKSELLLVRFGLNTLHVYTDAEKRAAAASIATALAGWWTGGAGIPAISNLIMCGWGMGESLLDVSDLMDGKSVPIYKMKGDWRLDIGLASKTGPKTDRRLYFNYYDYLRLFLLTRSEKKKLDRIEDLIQLNIGKSRSGFRVSESCTYVRVEAEVSMKYLFITRPFVQRELKTCDGRHVFKVLVYEGY